MQLAVVAAGFTPGESDQLRRAMAAWKRKGGLEHLEQRLLDGMRANGYDDRIRRADLSADSRLRRVRLSRIARGELRAAGVRLVVAQVLRAGGVHLCVAEFAADGILFAVATDAGPAPARRHDPAGRCLRQRVGMHAGRRSANAQCRRRHERDAMTGHVPTSAISRSRRCASACAWSRACRKPAASGLSRRAGPSAHSTMSPISSGAQS